MIYFAYASNMDPTQMRARCRGAQARGIGYLADHRLTFPRWSNIREHAVASVEVCADTHVWGVLFDMTEDDWANLHRREGYVAPDHPQNGYDLHAVDIDMRGEIVAAHTYVAKINPIRPDPGLTSVHYLNQIIAGALAHNLPDDYLARLRAVPTFD